MMAALLTIRNVCKSYRRGPREITVLADVSVEVNRGQIVAVIGSHSEGKTTLLKIAAGLVPCDRGEVSLAGRELASLSARDRRRLLGREIRFLDRRPPRLHLKVRDLVAAPMMMGRRRRRRKARALALAALDRVGAGSVAGQRWQDISDWERVLVVLAGGIVDSPELVIIDDLLDGHGASKTSEVGRLMRSLVAEMGFGVLMSVSDWEAALLADRILNFEGGGLALMSDHTGRGSSDLSGDVVPFSRRRQGHDGSQSTSAC
jgi:putative ABC transport system ATP-binding protein